MRTATKPRPRTKAPEVRRDDLMHAAQRIFLEQGVAPTTIEQITSGAGVAKGTFYLYFSSKEDLLAALGERFAQELLMGIRAAIAKKPEDDWKGKLTTWARACVTGYLDSIRLHDVVFFGSRPRSREGSSTISSSIIFPGCCRLASIRGPGRSTTLVSPRSFCSAASTALWMTHIPRRSASTAVAWCKDRSGCVSVPSDYRPAEPKADTRLRNRVII